MHCAHSRLKLLRVLWLACYVHCQSFHVSQVSIDGLAEHDQIGYAMALSENVLVIASPYFSDSVGVAMRYTRSSLSDSFKKTTEFIGPKKYEKFGAAVAISDGRLFVGAPGQMCYVDEMSYMSCGAVFVYTEHGAGEAMEWTKQRIDPPEESTSANFGFSLATSSAGVLAVGAPGHTGNRGAVFLYKLDKGADIWEDVAFLESPSKEYFGKFGFSVGYYGDILVVGAPGDTVRNSAIAGSVSIYADLHEIAGTSRWSLIQRIFPSDPSNGAEFGYSVSIHGDTITVGACGATGHSEDTGAVYLYEYMAPHDTASVGSWAQTEKLIGHDSEAGDLFGCSVSLSKSTLAVGACGENGKMTSGWEAWQASDGDNCGLASPNDCIKYSGKVKYRGDDAGAVYVFRYNFRVKDKWAPVEKILPTTSGRNWRFGWNVLTDGSTIAASADRGGVGESQKGAVYDISIDWSDFSDSLRVVLKGMLIAAGVISVAVFAYVIYVSKAQDYLKLTYSHTMHNGASLDFSNNGRITTITENILGTFWGTSKYSPFQTDDGKESETGVVEWGISR